MVVTLGLCFLFIKPRVFNLKNIYEYVYFANHIGEIDKIVLETYTLIGKNSYLIDKEKGKDFLMNLKLKRESNYTVTDSNATLFVYFKSGDKTEFNFEYNNFKYGGKKYETNLEVWELINENNLIK
jgi:hypothetical protein